MRYLVAQVDLLAVLRAVRLALEAGVVVRSHAVADVEVHVWLLAATSLLQRHLVVVVDVKGLNAAGVCLHLLEASLGLVTGVEMLSGVGQRSRSIVRALAA